LLEAGQIELGAKLALYRQAWREAGHPGEGRVTLMLHTLIGRDEAEVKALVTQPLTDYLRSSVDLLKGYAWSFPALKRRPGDDASGGALDLDKLTEQERDGVLNTPSSGTTKRADFSARWTRALRG
jgi:alkanesulfonate monooxygenase SsuD/methylene tetrahydromethanopterin reductase-like flavin-dependent oxidoreductase (luciferase family)